MGGGGSRSALTRGIALCDAGLSYCHVGLWVFSLAPALVVFYAPRRSRKAASTTFIVFVILAMLGQVGEAIGDLRASANRPHPFVRPDPPGE